LLRPELLEKIHIKVGSVEFELQKLQHDQEKRRNELDDVRFVLTLLLEPSELQHLKNIDKGTRRITLAGIRCALNFESCARWD
jgi:hypothetical protein